MVDVQQTNDKLRVRAQNIVMEATGCSRDAAAEALSEAEGSAKVAIVMLLADVPASEAKARLARAKGKVRGAIA